MTTSASKWPLTADQLTASGYKLPDFYLAVPVVCSGETCRARILFVTTPSGKSMPMTVEERPGQPNLYSPHFIDCPDVKSFRRRTA
jgi:hypothetical protein